MPRIDLKARKTPLQTRAQVTVEAILAAAAHVLERESPAGFNTNRVAEVAGVSIGSLHQYFPNKSALVTALIDRHQHALAGEVEACVAARADGPLREALAALARIGIAQQYGRPLLSAALGHEERRLPMRSRIRGAEERIVAGIVGLLRRHGHLLSTAPSHESARDLLVIAKALVEADAQDRRTPPPDLEGRIVRAPWGYLSATS